MDPRKLSCGGVFGKGQCFHNIAPAVTRPVQEIRVIVAKHQGLLRNRLAELDSEYPPATGRLMRQWLG